MDAIHVSTQFNPVLKIWILKLPELSFPLLFSLRLFIAVLSLLAFLKFSLIKSRERSTAKLASSTKFQNLPTTLLYFLISIGYRSAAEFNTKYLPPVSTLSRVQLLYTYLSYLISIFLLVLFVQPQILGFSVFQGCAGGLLGKDPFGISDLSPGTLFLSLSGMPRHSPLSSQNLKPTSFILPTDLSFSFFYFHQSHDKYVCAFAECVYV